MPASRGPVRTTLLLLLTALLAACGGPDPVTAPAPAPAPSSPVPSTSSSPAPSTTRTTTTTRPAPSTSTTASGKVVVLDPGHNGGNAAHPSEINRQVPAGRGQRKPCNTTGTATNGGYPEHAFTWDVSQRVRTILAAHGVRVVLTRDSDTGVGPCVDERAAIGNEAHADAVVSIHADGATSAGAHGFHVAYSSPPLNAAQGAPSLRLASTLRDHLSGDGFATSTYIGRRGLSARSDLAGLNLSQRPIALVECGNMRNATEAATLTSASGRQHYAQAIADGILAYLG